ncbi:MAG: SGNH/GDSL hydrolase family protein [Thermodesulfobacteriota bacterium]
MNHSHLSRIIFLFIAFQLTGLVSVHADNDKYKLVVFGDSLVDIGNSLSLSYLQTNLDGSVESRLVIPPTTRYDRGHYSNGPVVSDYLARKFKVDLKLSSQGADLDTDSVCYGYGGSETGISNSNEAPDPRFLRVPGLRAQVDQYIYDVEEQGVTLDGAVFFMNSGSNDYHANLVFGKIPPPSMVVDNIIQAATALTDNGAELVVVANVPDLGQTPFCNMAGLCDVLGQLALVHNQLLAQGIAELNSMTDSKVIVFDTYSLFREILADPISFDLPDDIGAGAAGGCIFQPPFAFQLSNCASVPFKSTSLFWDEMHPVTEIHKIFAKEVWKQSIKNNLPED